jgi:hypothetical protein
VNLLSSLALGDVDEQPRNLWATFQCVGILRTIEKPLRPAVGHYNRHFRLNLRGIRRRASFGTVEIATSETSADDLERRPLLCKPLNFTRRIPRSVLGECRLGIQRKPEKKIEFGCDGHSAGFEIDFPKRHPTGFDREP